MTKPFVLVLFLTIHAVSFTGAAMGDGVLFRENFDDADLAKRNWYDGNAFRIVGDSWAGKGCIEYEWLGANTKVSGSSTVRHLFEPTDEVCIRFHLKLSKGWGWTGRDYHPHLMNFLTTENSQWHGPAASHLTLYVEPHNGKLRLAAQDIQNANTPHGLTQGPLKGGYNGIFYDSPAVLLTDDQWHCIEACFKLNTLDLKNDRPNRDGIVRAWFDGKLVVERTDVILRSTGFPGMKFNQFLMAPYFGPGLLPHPQKLWIDELAVGTKRIGPLTESKTVNLEAETAEEAVRAIAQAYVNRIPAPGLQQNIPMDEALKLQRFYVRAIAEKLGERAGYKVGLVTPAGQQRMGVTSPVRGVLLREMLLPNKSKVPVAYATRPVVEVDLLVTIKDAGINQAKTIQEAAAHVREVAGFIELADSTVATNVVVDGGMLVAMNVGARAGVLGERREWKQSAEFTDAFGKMAMVLKDGEAKEISRSTASEIMGHPLNALLWLVEDLKKTGESLRAGDVVSLGSPAPPVMPKAGQKLTLTYEGLPGGPVHTSVTFQ